MGQVWVTAKVENLGDLTLAEHGLLAPEQVHRLEVQSALVDTGSTTGSTNVGMPKRFIEQLGLVKPIGFRESITATGVRTVPYYGPIKLHVMDRFCFPEVSEVADECPILIGYIPLEMMDFVVDPTEEKLIGNPRHGGKWMTDLLALIKGGE